MEVCLCMWKYGLGKIFKCGLLCVVMAGKKETLEILNRELNFEEEVMNDLANYFLVSLDGIDDLSADELVELREKLSLLRDETEGHRDSFVELIKFVEEDGKDNY